MYLHAMCMPSACGEHRGKALPEPNAGLKRGGNATPSGLNGAIAGWPMRLQQQLLET